MQRFKTLFTVIGGVFFVASMAQAVAAIEPCDDASGVLGGFPRAFCLFDTPAGEVGGPVNIGVPASAVTVPTNPGGTDDVDVFVLLANEITAPPAMDYTTTFDWGTPVDPSGLIFREWVGNFNFSPPRATALAYVNAPDPGMEIKPAEFSWIIPDPATGLATGARVGTGPGTNTAGWRNVAGLPPELPALERYHFQITGLAAGTEVTFTKNVVGGQVVPEPSSGTMIGLGLLGFLCRRRRCRRQSQRFEIG